MESLNLDQRELRIIRRCAIVITALVLVWAMQRFQGFLVPTMIGLFLALVLTPVVSGVETLGLPRGLAAALVVATTLLGVGAVIYALIPTYDDYVSRFPEIVRDIERKLAPIKESAEQAGLIDDAGPQFATEAGRPDADAAPVNPDPEGNDIKMPAPAEDFFADVALSAPALLGSFLYVVFLTFFTIYDRRRLMRLALASQRSFGSRAWVYRVIRRMRTKVARYLMVITAINCSLGFATCLVFWALGMPNPMLWGAGMTALNFVPYIGPAVMNVLVFAVAFLTYPTIWLALLPVLALLSLNLLEGQLVTPMFIGSKVVSGVLPVFIAVAFGAWIWGAVGALLATPALIVGQTLLNERAETGHPARRPRAGARP